VSFVQGMPARVQSAVPLKHGRCMKGHVNTIKSAVHSSRHCIGGTNVPKSSCQNIKRMKNMENLKIK